MEQKEKPPQKHIDVYDIPYNDFLQFQQRRRYSLQIYLEIPPIEGQEVVLHCIKVKPPLHPQRDIRTYIIDAICLDILLVTKNFYDITLGFGR